MKTLKKLSRRSVSHFAGCYCKIFAVLTLLLAASNLAKAIGPEWKIFTPVFSYNKGILTLDQVVKTKGIIDVVKGNDGTIWMACEDSYPVCLLAPDKKEFRIASGNTKQFQEMNFIPSEKSAFVKSPDGRLWLITSQNILSLKDTLSDWEGINVLSGKKSNGNSIPIADFDVLGDIQTDRNGNIFITGVSRSKVKAGIAMLSGDKWIYYSVPEEMINTITAASGSKKTVLLSGSEMTYAKSPELQILFQDLNFDSYGNIWMIVGRNKDRGVCKFSKGEFKFFTAKNNNLPSDIIMDIATDVNGMLHIATDKGLIVMNADDKYSAFKQEFAPVAMTFDTENRLWWSSSKPLLPISSVVSRYDMKNESSFDLTANNTPLSDEVKKIYVDENNNIYFITSDKAHGLYILSAGSQVNYPGWQTKTSFMSGTNAMFRYSLTAGINDQWNFYGISEFQGKRHLNIYKEGKWDQSSFILQNDSKSFLSNGYNVNGIARDNNGNLYLATTNYVYKYAKDATSLEGYDKSKISKTVNCIASDKSGNIWFGTTKGLAMFDGAKFTYYDKNNSELPGNFILNLLADNKDRLWVGTPNGLLCIDKDKKILYDKKNGLKTERIVGLSQDNNGKVYIATSNFNTVSESIYTEENGALKMEPLPELYRIGCMACDKNDNLWIGCENVLLCRKKDGQYVVYNSKNSPLLHAYNIERLFVVGDEVWLMVNTLGNVTSGGSLSGPATTAKPAPVSKQTEIMNSLRPRLSGLDPGYITLVYKPD